jgi:hypothetical protein
MDRQSFSFLLLKSMVVKHHTIGEDIGMKEVVVTDE